MIDFISQSMLGMFLRCPQQFERRYMKGEIIPPGVAARRGSAVHKAAAINHLAKLITKEDEPLDVLTDAARDEYMRLVKEEGIFIPPDKTSETASLLNDGLNATVRLTKLYLDDLAPWIDPVKVEERLAVDVGLGIELQGTIDVTTVAGWLPDLKTAEKKKSPKEADNSLQLTFYAGLYCESEGKWPDRLSLEVLVDSKTPTLQSLETTRGPEEWANLMLRIQLMIAQIEAGLFPPCDPTFWMCDEMF